jgi:hypothetical protein
LCRFCEVGGRGLEFLFSRNRLNVAISRAQCLAYLVASPRLLDANCRTAEQMRLANALCRFGRSRGGDCYSVTSSGTCRRWSWLERTW